MSERALTVTVPFEGTARGAVNRVVAPLAVCTGEKDPQLGALPQLATQSTPALAASLLTVAESWALLPTTIEVGGAWTIATEMTGVWEGGSLPAPVEHPDIPQKAARLATNIKRVLRSTARGNPLPDCGKVRGTFPLRSSLSGESVFTLPCRRFITTSCPFKQFFHLA